MARRRRVTPAAPALPTAPAPALPTAPATPESLLSAADLQVILGCGRAKAYTVLRLLGARVGKRLLLTRARLDAFLAQDALLLEHLEVDAIADRLGIPARLVRQMIAAKNERRAAR